MKTEQKNHIHTRQGLIQSVDQGHSRKWKQDLADAPELIERAAARPHLSKFEAFKNKKKSNIDLKRHNDRHNNYHHHDVVGCSNKTNHKSKDVYKEILTVGTLSTIDVSKYFNRKNSAINFTYEVAGLPTGLTFNASNGQVVGAPAVGADTAGIGGIYKPGSYLMRVTEIDPRTKAGRTKNILLHVIAAATIVSQPQTLTLASGIVGDAYTGSVTFSGSPEVYSGFKIVSGTLPAGLSLSASDGRITGAPANGADKGGDGNGAYKVTFVANDSGGKAVTTVATLVIAGRPVICSPVPITISAAPAISGKSYIYSPTYFAAPGVTATSASVVDASELPGGLVVDPKTGALSGMPSSVGSYQFDVRVVGSDGSAQITTIKLIISAPVPMAAITLDPATSGNAYIASPAYFATPGVVVTSASVVDASELPNGLTVDPKTGALSGMPSSVGSYRFDVRVVGSDGSAATRTIKLIVNAPVPVAAITLDPATSGNAYIASPAYFATPGVVVTSASVVDASELPNGLTVDPKTGALSGLPSSVGSYRFDVRVVGSDGSAVTRTIKLIVQSATVVPIISANAAAIGTAYSFTPNYFTAAATQVVSAVVVDATKLPDGITVNQTTGLISGTPTKEGNFTFGVNVRGSDGSSATRLITLVVSAGENNVGDGTISSYLYAEFTYANGEFPLSLQMRNEKLPYSDFKVIDGVLPDGLTMATDGNIVGTIKNEATIGGDGAGNYAVTFSAVGSDQNIETLKIIFTIVPPMLREAKATQEYVAEQTLYPEKAPYTSARVVEGLGVIPDGLILNSDGTLTGVPSSGSEAEGIDNNGFYLFTVSAKDKDGLGITRIISLKVNENYTEISAIVGESYSYTPSYFSNEKTVATAVLAENSDSLPNGLNLDAKTGAISGTPAEGSADEGNGFGTYRLEIVATALDGTKSTKILRLVVAP